MSIVSMAEDAVVPGSGEVISLVEKLGPYILIVVAAVGAYWWADERGRHAQAAKDQATITTLVGQRNGWRQYATDTKVALDHQSAAVTATAKAGDDKVAAAHALVVAQQKRASKTQALIEKLKTSAAHPRAPGDECTVSEATKEAWPDAK